MLCVSWKRRSTSSSLASKASRSPPKTACSSRSPPNRCRPSSRSSSDVHSPMKSFLLLLASLTTTLAVGEVPDYQPQVHVTGVLRSCGNPQMAALLKRWQAGFTRLQPDVQFADDLKSSASGLYGLDLRTADLALLGPPIFPYERYGVYERSWVYPAVIEAATSSAVALHTSPAY